MSYLHINLFNQGDQARLNPDEAILRLQEAFPEALVLPGDQLTSSALRAEEQLDPMKAADCAVVRKLWWDARRSGPAYAFFLPAAAEPRIEGVIKRFQADFHSTTPFSDALRSRIVTFLRSLIPQGVPVEVCEERDDETVALTPPLPACP